MFRWRKELGTRSIWRSLRWFSRSVFEFHPEIVFYQSGVDGLYADALGKLKLTHEGLKQRDRLVMTAVRALAFRLWSRWAVGTRSPSN